MKSKLNLTIESSLLQQIKYYAAQKNKSVSSIVEEYFSQITHRKVPKESIFDFMKEMNQTGYPEDFDFKSTYFEEHKVKYEK